MSLPLLQIDAFADGPFAGNPAAVCFLDGEAPDGWMQRVAAEMNLSETAFVTSAEDGFGLRWFTPAAEVDLCGHATLAAAHALWETDRLASDAAARFHSRGGLLTAERDGDTIWLDFPALPPEAADPPDGLAEALGVEPLAVARSRFDWLIELADAEAAAEVAPDFRALRRVQARGVIVTAPGTDGADFASRFFAPAVGIDEDPVTGSAHCVLAPYWAAKLGRSDLVGRQLSQRGGTVRARVEGDRVRLGGRAVTVFRAQLLPEPV